MHACICCSCGTALSDAHVHSQPTAPMCRLVQWHDVSFGRHLWDLPRLAQPFDASAETRAAVFLTALLQGAVLPCLAGELAMI